MAIGWRMTAGDSGKSADAGSKVARPKRENLAEDASQPPLNNDSRFDGKLFLVLLDDKTHPSLRGGRSLWALTAELTYRPSSGADSVRVLKGFVTDLTSIPRIFWSLLPPDGPWVKAAVIHDYLYYTGGTGRWKRHDRSITRGQDYSREEADWILRDALADRGIDVLRRNLVYWAVRIGGGHAWGS